MTPLLKSNLSLLRSILTLDSPDDNDDPDLPDSIVKIAKDNKLKEVVLVEDSMSAYLPANIACRKEGIKLIFGLRVSFVSDVEDKTEASFQSSHKNIIFCNNKKGYQKLIEIATLAAYDNAHKEPRLSYDNLHEYWTDDLSLAIPFYDSFIHKNLLFNCLCVPDFRDIKPTVFIEDQKLPFDYLIKEGAEKFAKENNLETELVKSIYYKNREDFEAYMTIKCLNRKAFGSGRTLDCPNFDHMSSREFSWESYLEYD